MTLLPSSRLLLLADAAAWDAGDLGRWLGRLPAALRQPNVEALVIGGGSWDAAALPPVEGLRISGLRVTDAPGSGGIQKLGYHYALRRGFDLVVRLRPGDGAPEQLPQRLEPFFDGREPAALVEPRLRLGLPGTVCAVSTRALRRIPFDRNADDNCFDAELLHQLRLAGLPLRELPGRTPLTFQALRVRLRTAWCAKRHQLNLGYEPQFDVNPVEQTYDLKLGFASSHTFALQSVTAGAQVLDIGCGQGLVAEQMARKARRVVGLDQYAREASSVPNVEFMPWNLDAGEFPLDISQFDQIFLLDVIEHLKAPESFMENLRAAAALKAPEIVLTTGNIAFIATRLGLLFGHFDYGRQGILDRTHTRLFTFGTLRKLFEQTGYEILELRGIPAPFPKAFGDNAFGRGLVRLNQALIWISRGLFAYQIFIRARAVPTAAQRLAQSRVTSVCSPPSEAVR